MKQPADVYIGLGSNLDSPHGTPEENLTVAIKRLRDDERVEVMKVSPFFKTRPVGVPSEGEDAQPDYVNAAAHLQTELAPLELLALLQSIENEMGRVRTKRWSARTIDLDILLYGDEIIDIPATKEHGSLQVPHPRMAWRRFVLEPLCKLDLFSEPHPEFRMSFGTLLFQLESMYPWFCVLCPSDPEYGSEIASWIVERLREEGYQVQLQLRDWYADDRAALYAFPLDQEIVAVTDYQRRWEALPDWYDDPDANAFHMKLTFVYDPEISRKELAAQKDGLRITGPYFLIRSLEDPDVRLDLATAIREMIRGAR